ncbi:MAG: DUF1722 domain-containing protein [Planctomycetes bacterium]|nr:DUF1722 domain-containing protein [Planctomycetota bacterium]
MAEPLAATARPIRVGASACLLGSHVRYDGGHKRERFLTEILAPYFEFVPVCPEVESGLPVPRPTLRLVGEQGAPRIVFGESGEDYTPQLEAWARGKLAALERLELCGFVLKSDSPSCGMERVKVYGERGLPSSKGRGRFAAALMAHFPLLPVEEEGRLNDAKLRETFVESVFAYWRWRNLLEEGPSLARLVEFHRIHKYVLLAHSPEHHAALGRLIAAGKRLGRAELVERYGVGLMAAMRENASRRRHFNVLQQLSGYFRDELDTASRDELRQTLHDYRAGLVPLLVPLTLIRHHVRVRDVAYLCDQVYLEPHPKELMLRNHV